MFFRASCFFFPVYKSEILKQMRESETHKIEKGQHGASLKHPKSRALLTPGPQNPLPCLKSGSITKIEN